MAKKILFVVGNLTLTAGDQALFDALVARFGEGNVDTRAANNANKSADGYDAVVLASGTGSSNVLGYLTTDKGLAIMQHAAVDDALMFSGGSNMTSRAGQTNLLALEHDLNDEAGVDGQFVAFAPAESGGLRHVSDTNLAGGDAVVLLRGVDFPGASSSAAAFYYEAGSTLADGVSTAPGRRIFLPPLSEYAQYATPALLSVFTRYVAWAAGEDPGGGGGGDLVLTVTQTRSVTLTATVDGEGDFSYGFSQIAGPVVSLSGTGNVRTFEQPEEWTEDIVIRVTVTSDEGSTYQDVTVSAPAPSGPPPFPAAQYIELVYDAVKETWA